MIKKSKLVCGVGINDTDYPAYIYAVIEGRRKPIWVCPFYRAWANMMARCYSVKVQAKYPTYSGCTVSPEWHRFSGFRGWMARQQWEGSHLDKDILFPGNKVYGPETCVFVPSALNLFMTDHAADRGDCPIGVNWHKRIGKYVATCCNPFAGKREHLGYFTDPLEAHEAWRKRKHEHACVYADQQSDPRIAQALRRSYSSIN